jgi:elongator complex protein 3
LQRRGLACRCIRCREIRNQKVAVEHLQLDDLVYPAGFAEEHFISFVTPEDRLAGFLRLSLPGPGAPQTGLADLSAAAIIREVHVYGQSLPVGTEENGAAQHAGLGGRLIAQAEAIARQRGFTRLAVISALGTRLYYARHGFAAGDLYMVKNLAQQA